MTKEKNVTCVRANVAIILSENGAGIEEVENTIIALTRSSPQKPSAPIDLFIDLGAYAALRSTFFGVLGSTIQVAHVQRVALCNMSAATEKMARRFGIRDGAISTAVTCSSLIDSGHKFRISSSVPDALYTLGKESKQDHHVV